jgi:hypothetical protein
LGGGRSSPLPVDPVEPQETAATRRFSRHIVSSRSLLSSIKISLKKEFKDDKMICKTESRKDLL